MLTRSFRVMSMKPILKKITLLRIPPCRADQMAIYRTLVTRRRTGIQDSGLQFHFPNH